MKTRTKILIAAAVTTLVGSMTIAGISFAERREHGRRGDDRQGGWHEASERREHHGHRGHHGGHRRGERMMDNFDRDEDGKLTQAEVDQVRSDRFAQFDTDKDGKLALQEYEALWLDATRSRMVDRFQDLDEDGDAAVTTEEFAAPFSKLIDRMDRDNDGAVTRDEMRRRR